MFPIDLLILGLIGVGLMFVVQLAILAERVDHEKWHVQAMRGVCEAVVINSLDNDEFGSHCHFCQFSSQEFVAEGEAKHDDGCTVLVARVALDNGGGFLLSSDDPD